MKHVLIAGLSLAALAACDPSETPAPATATKPPPATSPKKPTAAKPSKPAPIKLAGTPHDEEYANIKLTWKASAGAVALFDVPGSNVESGKLNAAAGKPLEVADSVVLVTKPNKLIAKKGAKIFGATKFDVKTGKIAPGEGDIDVPAGDVVLVLKYAGEGMCFTRHGQNTYIGGCPSSELYGGNVDAKPELDWWVQPKGAKGWLKVDGRLKADVTTQLD